MSDHAITSDRLISLCQSNEKYFSSDKSELGQQFLASFSGIREFVIKLEQIVLKIAQFAGEYDFDEKTPANGYRSYCGIVQSAFLYAEKRSQYVQDYRGGFLFNKKNNAKEVDVCCQLLQSLFQIGEGLIEMHRIADSGCLLSRRCHYDNIILRAGMTINQEPFYGRAMNFHLVESVQTAFKAVQCVMTSYSEYYYAKDNFVADIFECLNKCRKYLLDPEARAQRHCDITRHSDINFLAAFTRLFDVKYAGWMVDLTTSKIETSRVIEVPLEPIQLFSKKFQTFVDIPVPSAHIDASPIQCRLISPIKKGGELSKNLIIHVHGGGFISQNSKQHELYLREWATKLQTPILSIDYSLAPEAPFPRAVEEVFYVYCWALKNLDALDSTGEKIVLVGDSAGGNLATTCVINAIDLGIVKPDGLLVAYGAFVMNVVKSPSRFMGLFDLYLQWSCAVKLMASYGQGKPASDFLGSTTHFCTEGEHVNGIPKAPANQYAYEIPKDYLLTPYWTPNEILTEFPRTTIISMTTDPCLDECIEFSKKLKKLSVDVQLDSLGKLPHGFLLLGKVSKEAREGTMHCFQRLTEFFK